MVEAVKNSTQIKNLPVHNVPNGANFNAGRIEDLDNESFFNQDLASSITDYGSDFSDLDGIDSGSFDLDGMDLSMYGSIALNKRVFESYKQQMRQSGYDYENQDITEDDQINLKPLSEALDEYRIFGMRAHHDEEVTEILQESKNSGKGVALFLTNCAEDGLKDPNQPISFVNLKNPLRLVNTLKDPYVFREPDANENINLLSEIAIKERSPEMAAAILEATSEGGIFGGVDSKTAEKLLIESKNKFDNEADYYKFITCVDKSYKKMFPGKSLNEYFESNYKPTWQKATAFGEIAAGAAIGLKKGGLKGAAVGAVIGGLAGLASYSMTIFGKNEEGDKLYETVKKARLNSFNVNIQKHTTGFGNLTAGFGGLNDELPTLN